MNTKVKPLLTFSVAAYNQERFVQAAIAGAFAQTYSPLQIILSDDCSSDRTFELMAQAAAYYSGPHLVQINRNPQRLGLAGHVNRVAELTRGELLVVSAGDDISLSLRTELTWQAWEATGRQAQGFSTQLINIDESGQFRDGPPADLQTEALRYRFEQGLASQKSYLRTGEPVVLGCTAAWSRDLFEQFGPLPEEVVYEDMALGFRARLTGGLAFLDNPLVLYRLHNSNLHNSLEADVTGWKALRMEDARRQTALRRKVCVAASFRADLRRAKAIGLLDRETFAGLMGEVDRYEEAHALELDFMTAPLLRRPALFGRLTLLWQQRQAARAKLAYRLLPDWSYYALRLCKARLRRLVHRPQQAA